MALLDPKWLTDLIKKAGAREMAEEKERSAANEALAAAADRAAMRDPGEYRFTPHEQIRKEMEEQSAAHKTALAGGAGIGTIVTGNHWSDNKQSVRLTIEVDRRNVGRAYRLAASILEGSLGSFEGQTSASLLVDVDHSRDIRIRQVDGDE